MGTLIKYEFKKSWKMKAMVLCFTAFFELVFLYGAIRLNDDALVIGITGLVFTTICGLFLIGVYSMHVLSKDINTKQSYMLFMTPNNSYKILGSKVIENCGSVLVSGLFYILLAIFDLMFLAVRDDEVNVVLDMLSVAVSGSTGKFDYTTFAMVMLDSVLSWVYVICVGYFAIVLCATFLKGNKLNGFLSFVAFLLINILVNNLHSMLYKDFYIYSMGRLLSNVGFYILLTGIFYFITAWIMDNKLSV